MTIYAALLVVVAQCAWYRALAVLPATTIANWSVWTPVLSIAFAFLLLGEVPGKAQLLGGVVIFVGVVVSLQQPANREPLAELVEKRLVAAS